MISSIKIAPHRDGNTLQQLNKLIDEVFPGEESNYNGLDLDTYRTLQAKLQDKFNESEAVRKIVTSIKEYLSEYLESNEFLAQSNIYVRGSRPSHNSEQENIGWHRETFYGPNMERAVNVWTPVRGCNKNNTLQYIPDSHLIPDQDIIVQKRDDKFTERFSLGHKLGFQYAPKDIVDGVDLSKATRMLVGEGQSAIFSGNLIHGAAENRSSNIRFSCDFRVIRKKDYSSDNKQVHFSSGKPYFIEV